MKAYLAGPEVFLPDAVAMGERRKAICRFYGVEALYPLDQDINGIAANQMARAIFVGNVEMIRSADVIIANLSPFRGVGADAGTAMEIGLGFALGKAIHGYSNAAASLFDRTRGNAPREALPATLDGRLLHTDGMAIEDFGLADDLMLIEAVHAAGAAFHAPTDGRDRPMFDLEFFEACVAEAAGRASSGSERLAR